MGAGVDDETNTALCKPEACLLLLVLQDSRSC